VCGRFTFHATAQVLAKYFDVADAPDLQARYNIAPTQPVPVLREDEHGVRRVALVRWGLIPFWAKDEKIGSRLVNARAETLAVKASFKHAFQRRRCLVLASGFYEWQRQPGGKVPMYVSDPSGRPYAFAALWERWRDTRDETLESCVVVTVPANGALAAVHDRMPALLDDSGIQLWLAPKSSAAACQAVLTPAPSAVTGFWPVSRRVNDPTQEGRELLQQADPADLPGSS
jgi:putative SOS response-associated peptidase YedK